MTFDFTTLPPRDAYKLLISTVVPRPIALVTSLDEHGRVNAAPFSFFNVVGSDPPLVVLGVSNRPEGPPKDTAANIAASKEFVVNLVSESIADAMNICATDFPADHSEVEAAGLELTSSIDVKPPRIQASPVNFECREVQTLRIGNNRTIVGQIVRMHIRDELVDKEKLYVDTAALKLIGRMGGGGGYVRTTDGFEIPRVSYAQWLERQAK